jgi:hypothetical protein
VNNSTPHLLMCSASYETPETADDDAIKVVDGMMLGFTCEDQISLSNAMVPSVHHTASSMTQSRLNLPHTFC